jgi:hypothetical protein
LKETKPVAESPRHIPERIFIGKTAHGAESFFGNLVIDLPNRHLLFLHVRLEKPMQYIFTL